MKLRISRISIINELLSRPELSSISVLKQAVAHRWPDLSVKVLEGVTTTRENGQVLDCTDLKRRFEVAYNQYHKVYAIVNGIAHDVGQVDPDSPRIESIAQELMSEALSLGKMSDDKPVRVPRFWSNAYDWVFKETIFRVEFSNNQMPYSDEEIQLLIIAHYDRERKKFGQLKQLYTLNAAERETVHRERIPEHVRIAVWRRDGGKCVRCGSRKKLEYDHIVPVSRGGSNTARNIELLCETCNRKKSNNIE